jgi:hypothetical protein
MRVILSVVYIHIQRIYRLCILSIHLDRARIVDVDVGGALNALAMVEHKATSYIPVLDVGSVESLYLIVIPILIQFVRVHKERGDFDSEVIGSKSVIEETALILS